MGQPIPRRVSRHPLKFRQRTATIAELPLLNALRSDSLLSLAGESLQASRLLHSARVANDETFRRLVGEGCVLVAWRKGEIVAMAGIDPDEAELIGPYVSPAVQRRGLGPRMLAAAERLAASMQLFRLSTWALRPSVPFFEKAGYRSFEGGAESPEPASGLPRRLLRRHFPARQTDFGRRVEALGETLGIPRQYARQRRLPLQPEAKHLAAAGEDIYGRPQQLEPHALRAWRAMQEAAAGDGVELQLVSGYRSVDYQAGLIRRKLEAGQSLGAILQVSAAPGFSEHHSGRAVDVTTPGAPVLEEPFEETAAFAWLQAHASDYGFHLSYPRDNHNGVLYEPWHWAYQKTR